MTDYNTLFDQEFLDSLFPADRADQFFEALYGDAEEGAYDISLGFSGEKGGQLVFEFRLTQRPGQCLRCNLTYGLPEVFSRHPLINVKGVVAGVEERLGREPGSLSWSLKPTRELSHELHVIPLVVS